MITHSSTASTRRKARAVPSLVLAGAAAALFAFSGGALASDPGKTKTTTISLNGYCNVIQLTIFPWHQAGSAESGCADRIGAGMDGKVTGFGKDLTLVENPGVGEVYLYNIQYPLQNGGT